MLVSIAALTKA